MLSVEPSRGTMARQDGRVRREAGRERSRVSEARIEVGGATVNERKGEGRARAGRGERGEEASTRLDEIEKVFCRRTRDKTLFFHLSCHFSFFFFHLQRVPFLLLLLLFPPVCPLRSLPLFHAASCCALHRPIGYRTYVRYDRRKGNAEESASLANTRCRRSGFEFLADSRTGFFRTSQVRGNGAAVGAIDRSALLANDTPYK